MKISTTKTEQKEIRRILKFLINHELCLDSLRYNLGIGEKEKEKYIRDLDKKYQELLKEISILSYDNKNLIEDLKGGKCENGK